MSVNQFNCYNLPVLNVTHKEGQRYVEFVTLTFNLQLCQPSLCVIPIYGIIICLWIIARVLAEFCEIWWLWVPWSFELRVAWLVTKLSVSNVNVLWVFISCWVVRSQRPHMTSSALFVDCLQAQLVYLNYGTWDDFESVTPSQYLEGKVALVRSGRISLEHKVLSFLQCFWTTGMPFWSF